MSSNLVRYGSRSLSRIERRAAEDLENLRAGTEVEASRIQAEAVLAGVRVDAIGAVGERAQLVASRLAANAALLSGEAPERAELVYGVTVPFVMALGHEAQRLERRIE
jgi:hypothetical protein